MSQLPPEPPQNIKFNDQKAIERNKLLYFIRHDLKDHATWLPLSDYVKLSDSEQIRIELGCDLAISSKKTQTELLKIIQEGKYLFPRHGLIYAGDFQAFADSSNLFFDLLEKEETFQLETTGQYDLQLVINAIHYSDQQPLPMYCPNLLSRFLKNLEQEIEKKRFTPEQLIQFKQRQREILEKESQYFDHDAESSDDRESADQIASALTFLTK